MRFFSPYAQCLSSFSPVTLLRRERFSESVEPYNHCWSYTGPRHSTWCICLTKLKWYLMYWIMYGCTTVPRFLVKYQNIILDIFVKVFLDEINMILWIIAEVTHCYPGYSTHSGIIRHHLRQVRQRFMLSDNCGQIDCIYVYFCRRWFLVPQIILFI